MSDNLSTVQQIYACFAQGDVPGILAQLADQVTFFNGADPAIAPFGGEFHGKDRVLNFFTALGTTTQTTQFETDNFQLEGSKVINEVVHNGVVKSTGKPFQIKALFTWTFDDSGKVIDWKGIGDYSSMHAALES